jgi:hypothetical protein
MRSILSSGDICRDLGCFGEIDRIVPIGEDGLETAIFLGEDGLDNAIILGARRYRVFRARGLIMIDGSDFSCRSEGPQFYESA